MDVQIFGTHGCAETRKALRFFKERRVRVHFVDLRKRAASPGELRRFADRFGAEALVDRDGKRFAALGLRQAHYGAERWIDLLAEEPELLRTPLTRAGSRLAVGYDPEAWAAWLRE